MLRSSLTETAHQQAEGCSEATFSAPVEAPCERPAARVVTQGPLGWGGVSSQVQEQLRKVQNIQATCGVFAATIESGAVVIGVIQALAETAARCKSS